MSCFGVGFYGKTDVIPGVGHVATRFLCMKCIPIAPMESVLLLDSREDDEDGVEIPLSAKSIALAYLRALLVGVAVCYIAMAFAPKASVPLHLALAGSAVFLLAVSYLLPPLVRASPRRAAELRRLVRGLAETGRCAPAPAAACPTGNAGDASFVGRFLERSVGNAPSIILAFDRRPALRAGRWIEKMNRESHFGGDARGEVRMTAQGLMGFVEYDGHSLRLFGVDAPAPEFVMEHTVETSHWAPEEKERVRRHQFHVLCQYRSGSSDPVEQYLALYRVALAACDEGLAGVLNEEAWNFTPSALLARLREPEVLAECRADIPPFLWTGLVKCFKPDGTCWFVTKGHHFFGVSDFAWLGRNEEGNQVADFMHSLFVYAYRTGASMEAGHTLEWCGEEYRFAGVSEYPEYLEGPAGTLVVQPCAA
ncbi:MAG: DUF4261 domain-containing protein [Planctomycetes bacterium]|nr:DUF4261 domain-containing protein [Planctomycetota bacterium]